MIALTDLYPTLTNIVRNLERDDVATVEALLIDVTGDVDAGRMLHRLAMWWGKTRNPDGWVYKSYEDWWAECRIKEHKLPRTKGYLERVGVEIVVKKAEGNPTRHYRLDVKQFFQLLARALKISRKKLALLMKFPSESNRKMEIGNGQKTITTESSPQSSPDVVVNTAILQAKKIKGISDHAARRLVAEYGTERIMAVAPLALQRGRVNPAGWFVQALKENWQFPALDKPTPLPPSQPDPAKWDGDKAEDGDTAPDFDAAAETENGDSTLGDTPTHVVLAPPVEPDTPECDNWKKAYGQLQIQMDRNSFDTYVRDVRFLRCDDGVYVIGAANIYARNMLQYRLYRDVRRVLSNVAGAVIELQFEVYERILVEGDDELPLWKLMAERERAGA